MRTVPGRALRGLAAVAAVAALAVAPSAVAAPVGKITRFSEGFRGQPLDLAAGPDGNVWFTDSGTGSAAPAVGRITPSGRITEFNVGLPPGSFDAGDYLRNISRGPGGYLWFTISGSAPAIGRITVSGMTALYRQGLSADADPGPIVPGWDGNLWLIDGGPTPAIVRVAPTGAIAEFAVPEQPSSLTPGPDGNLWFALAGEPPRAVGRITPSGMIATFDTGPGSWPAHIVAGSDGNLWFTDIGGTYQYESPRIGRITPAGSITMFSGLLPASRPGDMALGPDGNVWFTDFASVYNGGRPKVGRITPSGEISQFFSNCLRNTPGDGPIEIVAGPDGNVWFTHDTRRSLPAIGPLPSIARVTPDGTITEFTAGIAGVPSDPTVGPDGNLWFIERDPVAISRITPPSSPPNVFSVSGWRLDRTRGTALLRLDLPPGAGPMQLWGPQVVPRALQAGGCRAELLVGAKGRAKRKLTRTGRVEVKARVTFTPAGGEPFTQVIPLTLRKQLR